MYSSKVPMASEYLNADNEQSEGLGWVSPPAIVDQQENVFETATIQPVLPVQQCSVEKSQSQGVSDSLADDYHRYEYCSMGEMETELPSARIEDMTHRPTSLREFFPGLWSEFRSLAEELIQYGKAKSWKKKVLTVLVTATSAIVFYDLLFGDYICDRIEYFVNWMTEHSATAVLAFIALFVVSTFIMIPPTLLVFGAGYAFSQAIGFGWGVLAAVLSCSIGSCVGAMLAFLRSRYMMRDLIYIFSKRYPLVRAADRALKRKGFHVMLLLRLCPLIPFNGLNYCCGITGVRLEDFILSLIGVLPFQIFTVIVGATAGSFALADKDKYNPSQEVGFVVLVASGCAFGLIALVYIWKLVKKELRKELELTPAQFEHVLHPAEVEVSLQGGMESSVEVHQVPDMTDCEGGHDHWVEEDEEWFWVWT